MHTIDLSGLTCPLCPHLNGDHDTDGQCQSCVCHRRLTIKLVNPRGGMDWQGWLCADCGEPNKTDWPACHNCDSTNRATPFHCPTCDTLHPEAMACD